MTLKGRHWVMFWLVVALITSGSITARQSWSVATVRQLQAARDERSSLEARRGELERRIRQASSRQVLVPRAEANLGLHEPAANEITVLVIPADQPGGIPVEAPVAARDTVKKAAPKPRVTARTPARRAPARKAPTRRPAPRRH